MSGSWWVILPSWLPGSWRSFLLRYSVYSCPIFLISSASVRSIPFLSFMKPIFAWNFPLISLIFLKRSPVFPILLFSSIFFALITEEAFLISPGYSLELWFKWKYLSFLLLFFTQLFVRPPQTTILPVFISFPWGCSLHPFIYFTITSLSLLVPPNYFALNLLF